MVHQERVGRSAVMHEIRVRWDGAKVAMTFLEVGATWQASKLIAEEIVVMVNGRTADCDPSRKLHLS